MLKLKMTKSRQAFVFRGKFCNIELMKGEKLLSARQARASLSMPEASDDVEGEQPVFSAAVVSACV